MRALVQNILFAGAAYQQADLCADAVQHAGLWAGVSLLFLCFMTNSIIAEWLKWK